MPHLETVSGALLKLEEETFKLNQTLFQLSQSMCLEVMNHLNQRVAHQAMLLLTSSKTSSKGESANIAPQFLGKP